MKPMNRALVTLALAAALLPVAAPAHASFHLIKVTEVFPGTSDQPAAQFVELRMHSSFQNALGGHSVTVTDAANATVGTFTFSGSVGNGADQASILIATPEAATLFGLTSDLEMTAVIPLPGGKVCWDTVDCVSWGSYSGPNGATGTPFNASQGLVLGSSMERDITGGSDSSKLDGGDDSNDSAADFQLASPSPTNNDGQTGHLPGEEPPDTSPPTTEITRPKNGKTYKAGKLSAFSGTSTDALSSVETVEIALLRTMKNGSCKWWDGDGFIAGDCDDEVFVSAGSIGASSEWSYALGSKLPKSVGTKTKNYTLFARAVDSAGNEESVFETGRNKNKFEVE